MLAFSKAPHIKLGWLWKLARHRNTFGMRNWKKRYITLNTKSRVLSYYKSNVDLLGVAFNAAVVNKFNKNGDGMSTQTALEYTPNFIHKPTNIEHNKQKIVGHIVDAGFSDAQTNKILTSTIFF